MRNVFATTLAVLVLVCTDSRAHVVDAPKRMMPHQRGCATPLPTDFWNDSAAKRFKDTETWAWDERICLGQWADMRNAPGGNCDGEECQPAEIQKKGEALSAYRELRPEFLELILSHEPWASAPRHPEVRIQFALVRGDIQLDAHEITPAFGFTRARLMGKSAFWDPSSNVT